MPQKNKKVTTVSGKLTNRSNTQYIRGKYYERGDIFIKDSGDCFKLPGSDRYKTLEKGTIAWDYSLKQYNWVKVMTLGIINSNRDEGYFTKDEHSVLCILNNSNSIYGINSRIIEKARFIESFSDGYYYDTNWKRSQLQKILVPSSEYKTRLDYSLTPINMMNAQRSYDSKFKINSSNSLIDHYYSNNTSLFDDHKFGVEFETTAGLIPRFVYSKLGLIPVRDGSITGIEYVTIPLTGKKGLYTLYEILKELKKRTKSNYTCSMHIHISGMRRSPQNIISMFKLMSYIQDDIYDLFPLYKQKNFNLKNKNYTAPLSNKILSKLNYKSDSKDKLENDMSELIHYLSGRNEDFRDLKLKDVNHHPSDPSNSRKWNMVTRYVWFNLIPLIFTNKQTVEFRIFTMPDTFEKMLIMLTMSLGLVKFATNHSNIILNEPNKISNYNLTRILSSVIGDSSHIRSYLRDRFHQLSDLQVRKGVLIEENEIS